MKKYAEELIKFKLRPPEVYALTGYNKRRLRELYKEIHGERPKKGKLALHVNKKVDSLEKNLEIIIFFNVYRKMYPGPLIDIKVDRLIKSYKAYRLISENIIDFSLAYLVLRDIKIGWIKPTKCKRCGRIYLFNHQHPRMYKCLFCHYILK